jgi:hypothetical protein
MSTQWTTFLPVLTQSAATLPAPLAWERATAPCVAGPEGKRHA